MAPFRVAVHFFCFVLLLAFSAPRAQARESQFFSKAERYTAPKEASTPATKEELPAAKQDEEVQYKPDNGGGGGYGLYGHGPDKVPAATGTASSSGAFPTYTYNTGAGETHFNTESFPSDQFNNEEFDGGAARYGNNKDFNTGAAAGYRPDDKNYAGDSTPATNYYATSASSIPQNEPNGAARYGNNKDFNTGAAAGYRPDNKNYAGGSSIPQSEPNGAYKYYNKESNTRYPRYANQQAGGQYGMSDTRFLDNGRYFYDVKEEDSYRNGRYVDPARGNSGGAHGSFGGGQTFANGAGYPYGNNNNNNNNNNNAGVGNGYEPENNSMQGYPNNQQVEYVP